MNEIDTKKTQRIHRSKSWFLKKLNKLNRLLIQLIKKTKPKKQKTESAMNKKTLPQTPKKVRLA